MTRNVSAAFTGWLRRRHNRALLSKLSDHQLRDIGIPREDIDRMVARLHRETR